MGGDGSGCTDRGGGGSSDGVVGDGGCTSGGNGGGGAVDGRCILLPGRAPGNARQIGWVAVEADGVGGIGAKAIELSREEGSCHEAEGMRGAVRGGDGEVVQIGGGEGSGCGSIVHSQGGATGHAREGR